MANPARPQTGQAPANGARFTITNPPLLRALRKAVGLSEQDLADLVGVSHTTVGYWESGRHGLRHGIRADRAMRLLHALQLDPQRPTAIGVFTGLPPETRIGGTDD